MYNMYNMHKLYIYIYTVYHGINILPFVAHLPNFEKQEISALCSVLGSNALTFASAGLEISIGISWLPSGKINIDPENDQFIVETSLPIPIWQGLC